MQSILKFIGGRATIEITLPCTGIDRTEAARVAVLAHGLRPGQVAIEFTNPTTEGD